MVEHWIRHYGYFGLFSSLFLGMFGLPLPDESILTLAGVLAANHYLQPAPALAAAFLGSSCGITLDYVMGRTVGLPLLRKYGWVINLTEARLGRVNDWFGRYGAWTLFFGFFFPGLRHAITFASGTSSLRWAVFARSAYSGCLLWVTTYVSLGYFVGEEWHHRVPRIRGYLLWTGLGLLVLGAAYLLARWWRRAHNPKA
jgi:membrane protein DedA with SNARE-associated domain